VWPAPCLVPFTFAAVAFEDATLDCETSPSSPGLRTRTEMLLFDGFFCTVPERAAALCSLSADWPISWVPPPPAWFWLADCAVPFRLPAAAFEDATFDCETEPLLPGLRTRTEMFSFDAPS